MVHPLIAKAAARSATKIVKDPKARRRAMVFWIIGLLMTVGTPIILIVALAVGTTGIISTIAGQQNKSDSATAGDDGCGDTITSLSYDKATYESLNPAQVKNAQTIIGTTKQLGYSKDAAVIAIMVAKRESQLFNIQNKKYPGSGKANHDKMPSNMTWLEAGDHDSGGLFQQRKQYYKDWNKIQDPATATKYFLQGGVPGVVNYLDAVKGWEKMPKGAAAQKVQGSAVPDGYIPEEPFAKQVVDKLWGTVKESGGSSSDGASAQPVSADSGCGSVAISGSMKDLLTSWAHPDYQLTRLEQLPGYKAVVAQAKREGFYTGRPSRVPLGDDCGVFVTNLVVRSGWDKNFNYGGKGQAGNTVTQRAWMEKNWQDLGAASGLKESQLKPGDVGIMSGHIWIYTGPVPGKKGHYAEASEVNHYGPGFAPQFRENANKSTVLYASNPTAHYYRKKG